MKYQKLGETDLLVPQIGFGTSIFANFYLDFKTLDDDEAIKYADDLVDLSLKYGINYFDTSPWYGDSEKLLGKTLGKRPRNSYIMATKVGRYADEDCRKWFDFSYDRVFKSVENSIRLLNCEYIDLIQIHDFEFIKDFSQIIRETLPALDELRKQGKVRYIGINSYSIEHLRRVLMESTVKIDTVLTFCHGTLDDSSLLDHIDFFKQYKVGIINASPMSMGLYTEMGAPKWHRAIDEVKDAVKSAFAYCKERGLDLKKIAYYYSVALLPDIHMTVSSAASVEILKENMEYYETGLNDNEKEALAFILEKFFKPLNYQGYGLLDVKHYYSKIDELSSQETK